MKSVWSDETGRIINKVNKISCCVPLTSLYFQKAFFKLRPPTNDVQGKAEDWLSKSSRLKCSEHRWEVGVNVHFARLTRTKLVHSRLLFVSSFFFWKFVHLDVLWRVWSTAHRWFSWLSIGMSRVISWVQLRPTNIQLLKYLRNKCYLCNYISKWLDFKSSRIRTINRRSRLTVPSMFKMSTWEVK